ncbi:B-cell differentiation antigen CD72 [Dromiciops gliroides]|uniref:B-cell differentiation antigen CD72 n=1 Tax=Dromiciops gliroides TaxID=33562 RepID=UPI001CC74367|nr:B-cell differentiation antigen CD72 [Dromiciops gliroides]
MAESITYADLRFVKSPLKKSLSARLKQDPEVDEDGELTYENVQVPSAKDVFPSPAQPGLGGQTGGEKTEKTITAPYSVTSPISRRILPCPVAWTPYIFLSLLGTCLLLGVTTVSLGIQYMQISHQLRNTNQVLEVTNGSLWQELQIGAVELSRKEKDLHSTREELAQIQQNLKVEKEQHQVAEDYLLTCRLEQNKTELSLKDNMEEKRTLEEKLKTLQDRLKQIQSFLNCPFQRVGQKWKFSHHFSEYCCPFGWTLFKNKCLYISSRKKNWSQSNSFCQSLSSRLLVLDTWEEKESLKQILNREILHDNFWIQRMTDRNQSALRGAWAALNPTSEKAEWEFQGPQLERNTHRCWKYLYYYQYYENCNESLPFICEKEAIKYPGEMEDLFLH